MPEQRWLFELAIDGTEADSLMVVQFHGRESLSEGSCMTVHAVTGASPDVRAMPGKKAAFRVRQPDGATRVFHGVVTDAAVDFVRDGTFALEVTLAARVELLRLGRNCRIFQNKSVPDVVRAVLEEAGLRGEAQSWVTRATHEPQSQIVQFNESDYDFIARLLSAEGIGFMVLQRERDEQVVFFDSERDMTDVEGATTLIERAATQLSENVVWDVRERRRGASDQVMLRDYDPARPSVDLSAAHTAEPSTGREVYEHPGDYLDIGRGRRLARRLVERLQVDTRIIDGASDQPFLRPGGRFTIEAHARGELNAQWVVVSVEHHGLFGDAERGQTSRYDNRFVAMPPTVAYRPETAPEAPTVGGAHLAFITAPAGEEIHPDASGRVKLRYPWDRSGLLDDRSSTWSRVGQLALGGSMILPRQGYEVLVEYEFGDIDRPMVSGHLYNAEARPPYDLPGGNTRSSYQSATYQGGPGANELRFEDAAGAEEIFLNASKDLTVSVDHDTSWTVNNNQKYEVGGQRTLLVGTQHVAGVTSNRSLHVSGSQSLNTTANLAVTVGGGDDLSIGGMRLVKCGGDHNENTTGALDRTVGSLQAITGLAGFQREVVGSSTVKVSAALCLTSGGSFSSTSGAGRDQKVGALKLIKAKQVSISCKAAYTENGAAESVKCGGSRVDAATGAVTLSAGGGMSVKAKGVNLEARSRLVVIAGGCMITLTPSSVTVKAAKIDLTGAKGLNQIMHKGN